MSRRCCAGRRCSSRGGTSSDAAGSRPCRSLLAVAACSSPRRSACRSRAIAAFATDVPAEQVLYVSRPRSRGAWRCRTTRWPPTSTGFARSSISAGRAERRPAETPTTSCCIRCSTWPRRSTRTSTSPTGSARSSCPSRAGRARPARPGRLQLLQKGLTASPTQVGVHAGHRLRRTTGRGTTTRRAAEWFERAAGCPARPGSSSRWPPSTLAAGRTTAAPRALLFQSDCRVGRQRVDAQGRGRAACVSSTPWTPSTSCARSSRATVRAAAAAPVTWRRSCVPASCAPCRAIPTASIFALEPWSGDVHARRGLDPGPLPDEPPRGEPAGAGVMTTPPDADARRPRSALFGLAIGSFLNVCIYRIPAGQSIVLPPSRCTRLRPGARAGTTTCRSSSWLVLRGRCAFCGAGSRRAIRRSSC